MNDVLSDGTIVQDGLRHKPRSAAPERNLSFIPYPVKAQVLSIYAIDDEANRDGETYVCDLQVVSLGITLYKVPFGLDKADVNNYVHYGPVAASANVDFSLFDALKLDPKVANGSSVLVQFIDADVRQPIITKMLPHNQSGEGGVSKTPRPGKDDGDCYRIVFNGLSFWITKDGNLEIEQVDQYDPTFQANYAKKINFRLKSPLPDAASQEVIVEIDNTEDGKIALRAVDALGNAQEVTLDAGEASIKLSNEGASHSNLVTMDENGVSITTDKDYTVTVSGDQILDVTGDWTITVAGNAKIEATGDVELDGSGGKAKLSGGKVAIGGAAAELLDLVDQLLDQVKDDAMAASTHVHPTAVGPSGPPTTAASFVAVVTAIGTIKGLLGGIKGSL